MADDRGSRGHVGGSAAGGSLWLIGWLFTLGYLHLPFWRAVLGLIIWPYFLGAGVAGR